MHKIKTLLKFTDIEHAKKIECLAVTYKQLVSIKGMQMKLNESLILIQNTLK